MAHLPALDFFDSWRDEPVVSNPMPSALRGTFPEVRRTKSVKCSTSSNQHGNGQLPSIGGLDRKIISTCGLVPFLEDHTGSPE